MFGPSLAIGVGHICTNSAGLGILPLRNSLLLTVIDAVGVPISATGQDVDSLALMRRAYFSRAEYSERRFITKFFQVFDDFSKSEADVPFDVFEEASNRSNCIDVFSDVWPEMSGIILSGALSCG